MSHQVATALQDLYAPISFGGSGGGGGGGGGSSINQCTRSNPRGEFRDRNNAVVGPYTPSMQAQHRDTLARCHASIAAANLGEALSSGRRGARAASGLGIAGQIGASINCPRVGITNW